MFSLPGKKEADYDENALRQSVSTSLLEKGVVVHPVGSRYVVGVPVEGEISIREGIEQATKMISSNFKAARSLTAKVLIKDSGEQTLSVAFFASKEDIIEPESK